MKKCVFIIHGWDGHPDERWFPWLKRELESRGFEVFVPQMPEPGVPRIEAWVSCLSSLVGVPDAQTYFIGHSIGVQTILRYLETIDVRIGGVVTVAGFFTLIPGSIGTADDEAVAEPWLANPMDLEKIRRNANRVVSIFSDTDRFVPLENVQLFEEKLAAKTIVLHAKGHLGAHDHVPEVPEILEAVLELIR